MVQFPGFTAHGTMCSRHGTRHMDVWVTPFGHPRINGYLLLHAAFRSLSRPSSSASSKASAVDPFLLDHIIFMTLLYYLSKNKRIGGTGIRTLDPRLAKPML